MLADRSRQLAVADAGGWALRIACGAATFNARLALAANGTPAVVVFRPDDHDTDLIARLTPDSRRPASYTETDLFAAVDHRRSNRLPFWPDPVPPEVRQRLIEAARAESCWLDLLVGMTALTGFAQIAQSADRVLRRDEHYHAELSTWVHAEPSPDGVPVTAGAPAAEPQDLLPQRSFGTRTRAPGRDFEPRAADRDPRHARGPSLRPVHRRPGNGTGPAHRHGRRPGQLDHLPADRGPGSARTVAPLPEPLRFTTDRAPPRLRPPRRADPPSGSRIGRTASTPWPAGSSSFQSS